MITDLPAVLAAIAIPGGLTLCGAVLRDMRRHLPRRTDDTVTIRVLERAK